MTHKLPSGFEQIAMLNPVATLLTQMGHALHRPERLLRRATGACPRDLAAWSSRIALIPAIFALGWWVFTREAPRVAENL